MNRPSHGYTKPSHGVRLESQAPPLLPLTHISPCQVAGPTEIGIIADSTADPMIVATDLVSWQEQETETEREPERDQEKEKEEEKEQEKEKEYRQELDQENDHG